MSKGVQLTLNLKDAYIIKHALRDKENKDAAEQRVFNTVSNTIGNFIIAKNIRKKG